MVRPRTWRALRRGTRNNGRRTMRGHSMRPSLAGRLAALGGPGQATQLLGASAGGLAAHCAATPTEPERLRT
jgi:hypothetical protein